MLRITYEGSLHRIHWPALVYLSLPISSYSILIYLNISYSTRSSCVTSGGGGNEVQIKDRLVSQTAQPTSLNDKISVRSELRRAMGDLSNREAQIIEMRFGLSTGNPMTLEEIGKHFCVTRERIRQV